MTFTEIFSPRSSANTTIFITRGPVAFRDRENVGISAGVYDIVARAESSLLETERKTGLIRRFGELQAGLSRAVELAEQLQSGAATETDAAAAAQLIEILNKMKG